MKIKISEYIRLYFCSNDQTDLVNTCLSKTDSNSPFKIKNQFYSFNQQTNHFYKEKKDEDENISHLEFERNKPLREYEYILKKYAESFSGYDRDNHNLLNKLAIEITQIKDDNKNKIIQFDEIVSWTLLKYNKFHELLLKLGYPICIHQNNIWWGELSQKNDHFHIIENLFSKLSVDDSEPIDDNYKLITELFQEEEDEFDLDAITYITELDLSEDDSEKNKIEEEDSTEYSSSRSHKSGYKVGGRDPESDNRSTINKAIKNPTYIRRRLLP